MRLKTLFSDKYNIILFLIILFHLISLGFYHKLNTAPPTWDSAGHLGLGMFFAQKFHEIFSQGFNVLEFLRISNYYPPLIHLLGGFVFLVFGLKHQLALFIVEGFFLSLSFVYLFLIVKLETKNKRLALITVIIFSLFPHVWEQARNFHLDIPLVALLLASFYYLRLSDHLKDRGHTKKFFIFFALCQLTKWYAWVYLLIPFIVELYFGFIKNSKARKHVLSGLGVGILIFLVLVLPWYLANFKGILNTAMITSTGELGDPKILLSQANFWHYPKMVISHQITLIPFILVIFGLWGLHRADRRRSVYIYSLIGIPYFVFTFIQNKDLRYILPLTAIFAYVIAFSLLKICAHSKFISKIATWGFIFYLLFLFFFLGFNQFRELPKDSRWLASVIGGPYSYGWIYEPSLYSYNKQNWPVEDIVFRIEGDSLISNQQKVVLELADSKFYSLAAFEMYRRESKFYDMSIIVPYFQFEPFSNEELANYISRVDYAVVPASPGPEGLRNIKVLNQLIDYFESEDNKDFRVLDTYSLPDDMTITLYKKAPQSYFMSSNVREDSLGISLGDILFLDRSKTGGLPFEVTLYSYVGDETVINVEGGAEQRRIPVKDVTKITIGLPLDQQNVKELRGWFFTEGTFVKDEKYQELRKSSGNRFVYDNGYFELLNANEGVDIGSSYGHVWLKDADTIVVRFMASSGQMFFAYATKGWVWNNFTLTPSDPEILVPVRDLLQLETSSRRQLIEGMPDTWDFFACYNGDAVCFYPPAAGL